MKNQKSADGLLTPLSAPQTLGNKGFNGNLLTADKGVGVVSKSAPKKDKSLKLLDLLKTDTLKNGGKSILKSMILIKKPTDLELFYTIPPNSLLDLAVKSFKKHTDIALELPFFVLISTLSAWLVENGNFIDKSGKKIWTDLWTIILENSGGGKSFCLHRFQSVLAVNSQLPSGIQSSARFIAELSKTPHAFWVRDEIAQLLKNMETQTYLEELKDYLLKAYDNSDIGRNTVSRGDIAVKNPVLNILGLNVADTFIKAVTAESMVDGQAARFNYVIVKPDPDRPPLSVALYPENLIEKDIAAAWKKLKKPEAGKKYKLSKNAIKAFELAFYDFAKDFTDLIPPSFARRTLYKAIKYSLIYHIILNKANKSAIDETDMYWAMRLTLKHLFDVKELLSHYGMTDLEKVVRQVEELKKKFNAAGKKLEVRDVVANCRMIQNVPQAKAILELAR